MIAQRPERHHNRQLPDQPREATELCELDRVLALLEVLFTQVRVGPHEELAVAGLAALRRRVHAALESQRFGHAGTLREALLEHIAELGDPHTRIGVAVGDDAAGAVQLPVRIVARSSPDEARSEYRLEALNDEQGVPHGAVVTHLNGVPIHRLLAQLERWAPHDNAAARRAAALAMLTRRTLASAPRPLADWVEFGGPGYQWRTGWIPTDDASNNRVPTIGDQQREHLRLAGGLGWQLLSAHASGLLRLRLYSIPPVDEIAHIAAAVRCVPGRARGVILDLRGNRGGAIESVLPLARALGVHEPFELSQQFRNTPLLRRLLSAQPQWRHCSRPADGSWLRAVPLGYESTADRSSDARRTRSVPCVAIWVDGATHSAAEILAGVLQRAGVGVVGPSTGTAGGPVNAWTYPSLQALAPTAIEPLEANRGSCLPAARRMALQCWVARHCPLAAITEIADHQWYVHSHSAAGPRETHIAVQYVRAPRPGPDRAADRGAALLFFDRARPTFPDLPGLFGFQCGVRRTLLRQRAARQPLQPMQRVLANVTLEEGAGADAYADVQQHLAPPTTVREVA